MVGMSSGHQLPQWRTVWVPFALLVLCCSSVVVIRIDCFTDYIVHDNAIRAIFALLFYFNKHCTCSNVSIFYEQIQAYITSCM